MNKFFLFFIILSTFILTSCEDFDHPVSGMDDVIYVAADSADFVHLKSAFTEAFEKEIFTPHREILFKIKRVPLNSIERFKNNKNIVVAGALTENSTSAALMKTLLNDEEYSKLSSGSSYNIRKENLWSDDQLVIFLAAPTMEQLKNKIRDNKDELIAIYQNMNEKRLKEAVMNSAIERREVQDKFLNKYGWELHIQPEFKIIAEDEKEKYVLLASHSGTNILKVIFIHWMDNTSPEYVHPDSINIIKNKYVNKFNTLFGDSLRMTISVDSYNSEEVNFNNHYAIFTQGLWDYNSNKKGGPFINYTFFDEKKQRVYMLDGSIYAPKFHKKELIQQLDVILQSFRTK